MGGAERREGLMEEELLRLPPHYPHLEQEADWEL